MKTFLTQLIPNRRRLILIGLLAALAVLMVPQLAAAQDAITTTSTEIQDMYQKMVTFLLTIMEFLQRLIWPVLLMIGGLLKNDILFAAGMEEVMLAIWGNIRNIVNILFVIVLLGIAFYNVVGGSNQDYHIKTIIPRFIIALIVVNFSFLGVKVVLDGVNVVSTAIFALPGAVEQSLQENKGEDFEKKTCEGLYGKKDYVAAIDAAEQAIAESDNPEDTPYCTDTKTFTQKGQDFFANFDSHNAAIVLAVNLAEVSTLDVVNVKKPDIKDLGINVLFSIVLYVVYAISFVALMIILLVRLVVLWVTIVLSPLIALAFVLPESLTSSLGSGGDLKTQFVKNAIVPIPIAFVMSIGFIMLQSLKGAKFASATFTNFDIDAQGVNLLTSGLSTLQDVIVAVGVVVVIWVGVFKAAEGTAAQGIVEKIKGASEGFGKFVATAPFKYAPIVPVKTPSGEEKKVGLGTALGALKELPYQMERQKAQEMQQLAGAFSGQNIEEARDKMKGAKTPKELMQQVANVGVAQAGNVNFQQSIGESLRGRPSRFLNEFDWRGLKDKQGNDIKDAQAAIEALRKGEVSEESMKEWIRANQTRLLRVTREGPQPAAKPGTGKDETERERVGEAPRTKQPETAAAAAGAAVATIGTARAITRSPEEYKRRQAVLSDDQKAALQVYDEASEEKKKELMTGDSEEAKKVQAAFTELDKVRKGTAQFGQSINDAMTKPKEERQKQVIKVVVERKKTVREQVKKNNPTMSDDDIEKRVNEIVEAEMEGAPGNVQVDVKKAEQIAKAPAPGGEE